MISSKSHEQLRFALEEEVRETARRAQQQRDEDELDEEIAISLERCGAKHGEGGHKWMAGRLFVSVQLVHHWTSRKDGRRPPADMTDILYEEDPEFAKWKNKKRGYTVPEKLVQLSNEELVKRLRDALKEFGAVGEEKIRRVMAAPAVKP
jgi:NTP pyrophosphatase (non-canonical NTP hydrolase)